MRKYQNCYTTHSRSTFPNTALKTSRGQRPNHDVEDYAVVVGGGGGWAAAADGDDDDELLRSWIVR